MVTRGLEGGGGFWSQISPKINIMIFILGRAGGRAKASGAEP